MNERHTWSLERPDWIPAIAAVLLWRELDGKPDGTIHRWEHEGEIWLARMSVKHPYSPLEYAREGTA